MVVPPKIQTQVTKVKQNKNKIINNKFNNQLRQMVEVKIKLSDGKEQRTTNNSSNGNKRHKNKGVIVRKEKEKHSQLEWPPT